MSSVSQIKIFGERNTGTNWLEQIISRNYNVPLVHHKGIIRSELRREQNVFLDKYTGDVRKVLRERLIDAIFEGQRAQRLFGWKHSSVHYSHLSKIITFEKTGFIFLVKNPYSFLKSLHARPYNSLVHIPESLDQFVTSPWLTLSRDCTSEPLLKSPLELWNSKVASYLSFMEMCKNSLIVRYEDILEDQELIFHLVKKKFKVRPLSTQKVIKSTKDEGMKLEDYKRKYLECDPREGFEVQTLRYLDSLVDRDLIKFFDYRL